MIDAYALSVPLLDIESKGDSIHTYDLHAQGFAHIVVRQFPESFISAKAAGKVRAVGPAANTKGRNRDGSGRRNKVLIEGYSDSLRRMTPAKPMTPVPNIIRVPGSGTVVPPYSKLGPKYELRSPVVLVGSVSPPPAMY